MDSIASMLSMLRSGTQLDQEHVERMKRAIASEESAMADLDAKILALEAQRDALAKSLPLRRALIAPIRRLPPEVLADIFQCCLPTTPRNECTYLFESKPRRPTSRRLRVNNNKDAPFLLLRVCHKWRDIAEQTARLWTKVSIAAIKASPMLHFVCKILALRP